MARALAWQARGHRFEPGILHYSRKGFEVFVLKPFFICIFFAYKISFNFEIEKKYKIFTN